MSSPQSQAGGSGNVKGYTFTDTTALDEVIRGWKKQGDGIKEDRGNLQRDLDIGSPVGDPVTTGYFDSLSKAFHRLADHNDEMSSYTADYVTNLLACLRTMAGADDESAARFPLELAAEDIAARFASEGEI
jgi:hypothetical protein